MTTPIPAEALQRTKVGMFARPCFPAFLGGKIAPTVTATAREIVSVSPDGIRFKGFPPYPCRSWVLVP